MFINNAKRTISQDALLLKAIDFATLFLLLATACVAVDLVYTGPIRAWIDLLYDDAYYYLGIARGLVIDGTTSYLPPFETNGYQPLWLAILALATEFSGTTDRSMVAATLLVSFFFTFAFAFACHRAYGYFFIGILSSMAMPQITMWGMETAMIPLFSLLFLNSRSWQARGAFGSLIFLTRLDGLALVIACDFYHCWQEKKVDAKYLRHYTVLIPIALSYALINQIYYGIPVPVSGLSKAIGSVPFENLTVFSQFFSQLINPFFAASDSATVLGKLFAAALSPLVLLMSVLILKCCTNKTLAFKYKREIVVLTLTSMIVPTYYACMSGWSVWPWYSWPLMLWTFYVALEAIESIRTTIFSTPEHSTVDSHEKAKAISPALKQSKILLGLITLGIFFDVIARPALTYSKRIVSLAVTKQERRITYGVLNSEMASSIKNGGLPFGSRIAMGERAGSLGFLLGRDYSFIHTEGLVGPTAYYLAMKFDKGLDFLLAQKPDYLIVDRDQFYRMGTTLGVAEPVQGLSERVGPYLICFPEAAVVHATQYPSISNKNIHTLRYIFDFHKRVSCPEILKSEFLLHRSKYEGIKRFSLFSEY